MNTSGWDLFYKYNPRDCKGYSHTQLCYEPLINKEKTVFCQNYTFPNRYQAEQERQNYNKEFVYYMFSKEIFWLEKLQHKEWVPTIIDINYKKHKIFFKWYNSSCSFLKSMKEGATIIDKLDINSKLKKIILDQVNEGFYKPNMYPHTFYLDSNQNLKTFDFYCCAHIKCPYLEIDNITNCIVKKNDRTIFAIEDNKINIETLFKTGLLKFHDWNLNLEDLYDEIFNDRLEWINRLS